VLPDQGPDRHNQRQTQGKKHKAPQHATKITYFNINVKTKVAQYNYHGKLDLPRTFHVIRLGPELLACVSQA